MNTDLSKKDIIVRQSLGLIFASCVGVVLFYILPMKAYQQLVYGAHSVSWPTVEGEILTASKRSSSSSRSGMPRYEPYVTYAYTVNGNKYSGDQYRWNPMSGNSREALAIATVYQSGQRVPVFYNPVNPAHSVLQPGMTRQEMIKTSIAIFAGFTALLILFLILAHDIRKMHQKMRKLRSISS